MKRLTRIIAPAVGITLLGTAAACSNSAAGSGSSGSGSSSNTVTVLYSNNYVFNSDSLATKWWAGIAKQWKAKYPHTKLILEGTGGTDIDLMNKAAILFRSPSRTPDVIQMPTTYVAQFGGSGYLAHLSSSSSPRAQAPSGRRCPKNVQDMGRSTARFTRSTAGNNDSGCVYNKTHAHQGGRQDAVEAEERGPTSSRPRRRSRSRESGRLSALDGRRCRRRPDERAPGQRQPHFRHLTADDVRRQDQEVGC